MCIWRCGATGALPEERGCRRDGLKSNCSSRFARYPHASWQKDRQYEMNPRHAMEGLAPLGILEQPI
jgi:hypothetical protein